MGRLEVNASSSVCRKCGMAYGKLSGNFFASYSVLNKGVGYMPYCRNCVEQMYNDYLAICKDPKVAVRQMCRKLDLYWNEKIYDTVEKKNTSRTMMSGYNAKLNSVAYAGRSYDDTLVEEGAEASSMRGEAFANPKAVRANASDMGASADEDDEDKELDVSDDIITFWGPGYTPSMYMELEQRRSYWMSKYPAGAELDIGTEALIRQICSLEIDINKARMEGKPIDKYVNSLNTILGSANLKPVQNASAGDGSNDATPFGVWIKRFEDGRPIPEPDPELEDVDGVIRYFTIWVLGHLCKMLNIKNTYCKMYEDELAKMRIERPEYVDEDDETMFNDIFGDSSVEGGG